VDMLLISVPVHSWAQKNSVPQTDFHGRILDAITALVWAATETTFTSVKLSHFSSTYGKHW